MNNHKNIKEVNKESILVNIPYELRLTFKQLFPNATWNNSSKVWKVEAEQLARLNEYLNVSNDTIEKLEQASIQSLREDEITRLKSELEYINSSISRNESLFTGVTQEDIDSIKSEILEATEKLNSEKEAVESRKQTNRELVESVCDLELILDSQREMVTALFGRTNSSKKSQYNSAATAIDDEHDKLKEVGFYSPALDSLYNMNFNRPDRDKPDSISVEDILDLQKYDS